MTFLFASGVENSYARAFARRYPWVRYFTPVNEIFNCATHSALRG